MNEEKVMNMTKELFGKWADGLLDGVTDRNAVQHPMLIKLARACAERFKMTYDIYLRTKLQGSSVCEMLERIIYTSIRLSLRYVLKSYKISAVTFCVALCTAINCPYTLAIVMTSVGNNVQFE